MVRLSVREMFALVAIVALAIVSLKYASYQWLALVAALAMGIFFVAIIIAVVDRGKRQAFAIGFALIMAVYGLIVINGARTVTTFGSFNQELDPSRGRLPTTQILAFIHTRIKSPNWRDSSGKITTSQPASTLGSGGFNAGPVATYYEVPDREDFMPVGHLWWGMVLGLVGGWLALFVYLRRTGEEHR